MLVRTIVIGLCAVVLVGCATREVSHGGNSRVQPDSGGSSSSSGSAEAGDAANAAGSADSVESVDRDDEADAADAADGAAETDTASLPTPIDPGGVPLDEVMIPRPGIRLVYDVAGGDVSIPAELTLVLQPSRSARADISIHAPGAEAYVVMEETATLWRAALVAGDHSLTRALAELAYPRYLPTQGQAFRSADAADTADAADAFVVRADAERAWSLAYDSGATVAIRALTIEPMALDSVGPETIGVLLSSGEWVRLTLRSAAVYRQREISGAVVSAFGRPLSDITVAPHPRVGRLPASRVAVTDAFGAFTLPYRAAPGDSIRLFYGRTTGSGEQARIVNPQEISGRVASPDFTTLIFTEQ